MQHVLVDLTRDASLQQVYRGDRYHFAVRGLAQIAAAMARAGCRVTVLGDPEFAGLPCAAILHQGMPALQILPAADNGGFAAALRRVAPDVCVVWNGTHIPHVTACCRAAGVGLIFAEAGWFDREQCVFVDPVGVTFTSGLAGFDPPPLPDRTLRARLRSFAQPEARQRLLAGEYLLVLLDGGGGFTYYDPAHRDPMAIVAQLRARFPDWRLAVRAHPLNRAQVRRRLPPGVVDANDGDLRDWAAFCTAAVGASSKAVFAPVLFDRPGILIGASVASGVRPHPAFPQRHRIAAITEADLTDTSRAAAARAFVYEAMFHRHLYFDDCGPAALMQNRVLAGLLQDG